MIIDLLSLFPNYFSGPLDESILRIAKEKGIISVRLHNIRDFAVDKHRRVDDRPFGGGPGMVMMPKPTIDAIRSVKNNKSHVIYMSPQGALLNAAKCRELAEKEHLVILCGHYEGVDQRVLDLEIDEEISIGDYVLTNGCLAALVLLDSVVRLKQDVLGNDFSAREDSFENGMFDHPHYTKPVVFEERAVPDVLLSGNHQEIAKWRKKQAIEKTRRVRPDLLPVEEHGLAQS